MFGYKSMNCSVVSLYDFMCEIFERSQQWGRGMFKE